MTSQNTPSAPPSGLSWQRACALADLPDERPVYVDVAGLPICLIRRGDRVHALYDECSHESVPLSEGDIEGDTVECCQHGSQFDLVSGEALNPPATEPVPVYPVHLGEDGQVYVAVDRPPDDRPH